MTDGTTLGVGDYSYMWGEGRVAEAFAIASAVALDEDASDEKIASAADLMVKAVAAAIEVAFPIMWRLNMEADACVAAVAEEARDLAIGLLAWEPRRKSIAPRVRTLVFRRDGYVCVDCGEDDVFKLTVDHRVPVHFGGGHDPNNLVTRCRSCNSEKGKGLRP